MLSKLKEIETRFEELKTELSEPEIIKDQKKYRELMQELSLLTPVVEEFWKFKKVDEELSGTRELLASSQDADMKNLAKEELKGLEEQHARLIENLKIQLIPKDPLDLKNIIMEIRAGTGGEEAALFAADLFRMYTRFAEERKWKIEILSSNETGIGGFKEIVFSVTGKNVFADLRYEMGVHRVQRVPATESSGRIHTSAITVAVLPEAEETDIQINPDDIKIDTMRASGPGGQNVNKTDSAVRITHLPTGLAVHCQDEKSQLKNKAKAMKILRARLYDLEVDRKQKERAKERKSQIGTGDRSERIRTYNFPQNRLTDHRVNLTLYKLEAVMAGDVSEIIEALKLNAMEFFLKKTDQ